MNKFILKFIAIQVCLVLALFALFLLISIRPSFGDGFGESEAFFCEGVADQLVNMDGYFISKVQEHGDYGYEIDPPLFKLEYAHTLKENSNVGSELYSRLTNRIGYPFELDVLYLTAIKYNQEKVRVPFEDKDVEGIYYGVGSDIYMFYNNAMHQGYRPGHVRVIGVFSHEWLLFRLPRNNEEIDPNKLYVGECDESKLNPKYINSDEELYCKYHGVDTNAGYEIRIQADINYILHREAVLDETIRYLNEKVICENDVL